MKRWRVSSKTGGQCDGQQSEIGILTLTAPAEYTFTNARQNWASLVKIVLRL